jgi:hypothetical protein
MVYNARFSYLCSKVLPPGEIYLPVLSMGLAWSVAHGPLGIIFGPLRQGVEITAIYPRWTVQAAILPRSPVRAAWRKDRRNWHVPSAVPGLPRYGYR